MSTPPKEETMKEKIVRLVRRFSSAHGYTPAEVWVSPAVYRELELDTEIEEQTRARMREEDRPRRLIAIADPKEKGKRVLACMGARVVPNEQVIRTAVLIMAEV